MISAPTAQLTAEGAALDGLSNPKVLATAALGSNGRWPQNAARGLLRGFVGDIATLALYEFKVPAKDVKTPTRILDADCGVMLPHMLFSMIAFDYPKLFNTFTQCDSLHHF